MNTLLIQHLSHHYHSEIFQLLLSHNTKTYIPFHIHLQQLFTQLP